MNNAIRLLAAALLLLVLIAGACQKQSIAASGANHADLVAHLQAAAAPVKNRTTGSRKAAQSGESFLPDIRGTLASCR
jgi:hypothetical protein